MQRTLPLAGLRVLDVSQLMSGPLCAMMLGDMGAEVLKVERRGTGDMSRMAGTVRCANESTMFLSVNGPYCDRPGVDTLLQAQAGLMSITGEPGGRPLRVPTAPTDLNTAMLAAYGVLVALFHRERTGQGQRIETSLLNATIFGLMPREWDYFATGQPPQRLGDRHPQTVPFQSFRCANDRFIYVVVLTEAMWDRFCAAIERPELGDDPRFRTNQARVEHRAELDTILDQQFLRESAATWLTRLQAGDVLCAPINDFAEAFADPQVWHNEMVVKVQHPVGGMINVVGVPVKLSATPGAVRSAPPLLGQHTSEVLHALGYDDEELAALREEGVI